MIFWAIFHWKTGSELSVLVDRLMLVLHQTIARFDAKFCLREKC